MLTANRKTEDCAFLALLIGVTALFLWMMLPFFDVIFWAATIGILFHPVYRTIAEKWRMGRILSSFITILLCLVLIIIPLSYILYNCVVEATLLYQRLHSDQNSFVGYIDRIKDSYPFLQDWLHYAGYDLERIKSLLTKAALSASSFLARNTVTLGENTLGFLTNLALVLYIAFFLLMDGTKIQELLIKALPFGDHREKLLFRKFAEVTRATVKGSLLVAAAQGAPYDLFLSGSRSLLRIDNPNALSGRTLVVFRDSFGSSIIPLLSESYRTVYAVDIRYLASDRLGRVVDFPDDADVLLLYSTTVLHNSITLK